MRAWRTENPSHGQANDATLRSGDITATAPPTRQVALRGTQDPVERGIIAFRYPRQLSREKPRRLADAPHRAGRSLSLFLLPLETPTYLFPSPSSPLFSIIFRGREYRLPTSAAPSDLTLRIAARPPDIRSLNLDLVGVSRPASSSTHGLEAVNRHLTMAFHFNWSPLTADADFYRRARDLLTKALNKSPKPPIIVDDILVSELNLGTVPPDLEILEIGDLAEDRFRGIFKMCYSGDAFLTLKTRVQANPLNTYLYSKPAFTSPQPLAAASGLTIPLSITLSDIKLSAFIILVFSKQKGLTLVFRNDPLESLKVSSTFDSIQFVRDYLQRTIEQQLRNLMMDELPAIIHRLSLQLWCPDQVNKGTDTPQVDLNSQGIDPFASPPLDPVDARGNLLDATTISDLALDGGGEVQSLFSQKNLLRLAALTECHHTLSLFTPGIRDVVFRAWTGYGERSEPATPPVVAPSLTRTYSFPTGGSTTYTFSDSGSSLPDHVSSRASIISLGSTALGQGHRTRPGRKKKNRIVDLRRSRSEAGLADDMSEGASDTTSVTVPTSESLLATPIPEEPETRTIESSKSAAGGDRPAPAHQRPSLVRQALPSGMFDKNRRQMGPSAGDRTLASPIPTSSPTTPVPGGFAFVSNEKSPNEKSPLSRERPCSSSDTSSEILEQAWIMKMAGEIARRVYDEKTRRHPRSWDDPEQPPPPAYEATAL
ncbi:hypothetical protein XA68_13719 [Ophiocordyceps unilateralis]|uniref:Mitochondrial distribution and morphology protein 34 n=1 Tax=Ophiocordyceps unilateralis TaxID=268505 RepID=A0A2A9PBV6_OPHUN|nr:hypothetical protein XA68_13719 [Ophiocordyceps unilateralis]